MCGWPHWALTLPAALVLDTRTLPDAGLEQANAYPFSMIALKTCWRKWFLFN